MMHGVLEELVLESMEREFLRQEKELTQLKEAVRQKEEEMVATGKKLLEAKTGWVFGRTILRNPKSKASLNVLLDRAELRDGEFTAIGAVLNKSGGKSSQTRLITPDYEAVK